MIDFTRTILDAIDSTYGEDYITEPDLDQDIKDIYTETHFALANVLLYLEGGRDPKRLEIARTHFSLFEKLHTETPFNNFAVNLALALVDDEDRPLKILLQSLSRRQTLDRGKVFESRCGNNMYFMQAADDLIIRPVAWVEAVDSASIDTLLEELERFKNGDGLYFDEPRSDERPRRCPLTYCLKFLFLIGLCHALKPDERIRKAFVEGVRAARPLFTGDGDLSYFGRSDNTVFATGLAVFVHRMAAKLDADHAAYHARMCLKQEGRLKRTPRMEGGWLSVNRAGPGPGPVGPRDSYTYPTEYSAAAVCYVLLSRYLADELPVAGEPPEREGVFLAEETGLCKMIREGYEAICRTLTQPEVMDRRYLGPTVLRLTRGEETLVGTVPMLSDQDYVVRAKASTRAGRHIERFLHGCLRGTEPFMAHLAGYIPVLLDGSHIHLPGRRLGLHEEAYTLTARYALERRLLRGPRVAYHLARSLALKNLRPGFREEPLIRREDSPVELVRKISLRSEGLIIEDRIEGLLKGLQLIIGVRRFAAARACVDGLRQTASIDAWGSDGASMLDLYGLRCGPGAVEYAITISGSAM